MTQQVQEMFSQIAHRYDRANAILSMGVHHLWRRRMVRLSKVQRGMRVLDCATGTGDLAFEFARTVGSSGNVVGTDLNREMLAYAPSKARSKGLTVTFSEADVQALPFNDATFDVSSIAFGIRNVDDPSRALAEMARVVVRGGRVVVLEFGKPSGPIGSLYRAYSRFVIPRLGALITGNRSAYEYLPRTAASFPSGVNFVELMRRTGKFREVRVQSLTGGVAYVYVGTTN